MIDDMEMPTEYEEATRRRQHYFNGIISASEYEPYANYLCACGWSYIQAWEDKGYKNDFWH